MPGPGRRGQGRPRDRGAIYQVCVWGREWGRGFWEGPRGGITTMMAPVASLLSAVGELRGAIASGEHWTLFNL